MSIVFKKSKSGKFEPTGVHVEQVYSPVLNEPITVYTKPSAKPLKMYLDVHEQIEQELIDKKSVGSIDDIIEADEQTYEDTPTYLKPLVKPKPVLGVKGKLQAHIFEQHEHEWYAEDAWVSEALFRDVEFHSEANGIDDAIHDPFCGFGQIPHAAVEAGYGPVIGWDIVDRRVKTDLTNQWTFVQHDAMSITPSGVGGESLFKSSISCVSNPPYDLINDLLDKMHEVVFDHKMVVRHALFMPLQYLSGKAKRLQVLPLRYVLICTPRPNCLPGELILKGQKPGGGRRDFAWYVFDPVWKEGNQNFTFPTLGWLPKDASQSICQIKGKW